MVLFIQIGYGQQNQQAVVQQNAAVISDYPTDLSGVKVAVYEGYTSDLCINSRIALYNMFCWMNATVDYLNSSQIREGVDIWNYDILAIPDGLAPRFELNLGIIGLDIIREWVQCGGSYFGTRAGATLACAYSYFEGSNEEYRLKLFNGTGYGPINELDEMCVTAINIDTGALPTLTEMQTEIETLYRVTRYFVASEGQEIIPIGTYDVNDEVGMFCCHYGSGCAFLSGLSPEFEENSARDGTDFRDELDDPDSEWPLMLEISKWLVEESEWNLPETTTESSALTTSITSNTTTESGQQQAIPMDLLFVGSGIGAIAIVLVVVLLLKRR